MSMLVRLRKRKALGSAAVTVSVWAVSSPTDVSPTGTTTPSSGDLLAGLLTKARLSAASLAVNLVPSEHLTSGLSVKVTLVGSTVHLVARLGTTSPLGLSRTSES